MPKDSYKTLLLSEFLFYLMLVLYNVKLYIDQMYQSIGIKLQDNIALSKRKALTLCETNYTLLYLTRLFHINTNNIEAMEK